MYRKHAVGARGEDLACSFLIRQGVKIRNRNFRVRGGEIDIIAIDGAELIFVEVKARSSAHYGFPEEAVTRTKLLRICRAIKAYLTSRSTPSSVAYRFDIIAIDRADGAQPLIRHIKQCELPDFF